MCGSKPQQYPPSYNAMTFNAELFHRAACLRQLQNKEFEPQAGGRSTEKNLFVDFLHVTHMILVFYVHPVFLNVGLRQSEETGSLFDNTVKSSL